MQQRNTRAPAAGRAAIIPRPRLTKLLDEAPARIVMLIAPAGYGKTTLARQWVADRPHAWYQGTAAAADVAALAAGLARAIAKILPGAANGLSPRLQLAAASPPNDVVALADLLTEELSQWPDDAWLVLDDYQFACDSEVAEGFVERVLINSQVRTLVISRSRPRWGTARRVLYGEVFEIGRSSLAMNQEETEVVFALRSGLDSRGMFALADGWPALIGLAAAADDLDLPESGVPDTMYRYFAQDVYLEARSSIRRGLRRLSVASALTPRLADSLVGSSAEEVIREGQRLGFFGSSRTLSLNLHPLLRSFLLAEFAEDFRDTSARSITHLAQALIAHNEWDDAFALIDKYLPSMLPELLRSTYDQMLVQARIPTLSSWVTSANQKGCDDPILDLVEAEIAQSLGDYFRAETLSLHASRRFGDTHPLAAKALCTAGRNAHMASHDSAALDHFARAAGITQCQNVLLEAMWGRFLSACALESADAQIFLDDFEASVGQSADELLRLCTGRLYLAPLTSGFRTHLEAARALLPLTSRSRDPLIVSSFLNACAYAHLMTGQYEEGLKIAEEAIVLTRDHGLEFAVKHLEIQKAAALIGLREFRRATRLLVRSIRSAQLLNDGFLIMNAATLYGRLQITLRNFESAIETMTFHHRSDATRGMEAELLSWSSFANACAGHEDEARRLKEAAILLSRREEVIATTRWTEALMALASSESESQQAVRRAFENVVDGQVDVFVTTYRACPELLLRLARSKRSHITLEPILEAACDHSLAKQACIRIRDAKAGGITHVLSNREQEVLELVSQGLSNKEIGNTLFIAESTAKAHVRRIFQKLGVRTRTEAALRAAELTDSD